MTHRLSRVISKVLRVTALVISVISARDATAMTHVLFIWLMADWLDRSNA
jgi:hypothetical protein